MLLRAGSGSGSGSGGSSNTAASLIVNQGLLFPKTRAAASGLRGGANDVIIGFLGDSTTVGFSLTSTAANTVLNSFPGQLMQMFRAANIPANINSVWGDNNPSGGNFRIAFDDRVTTGGTWAIGGSPSVSLGGTLFTGTSSDVLSFRPREMVDSFDIYTPQDSTFGSVTIDIDGGTGTVVNENGAKATIKTTVTASTLGFHTLNITATSGTGGVIGIVGKNSAQKSVYFFNWGVSSARADQLAVTNGGYLTLDALAFVKPDLLFVDAGINDWLQAHGVSSFTTAMTSIVTTQQAAGGDTLLVTPVPTAIATIPLATQQLYVDATIAVGAAASPVVPVLDIHTEWKSQEFSNALVPSLYGGSTVHPAPPGYTNEAATMDQYIAPNFASVTPGQNISSAPLQPSGLPYTSDTTGLLGFGYYAGGGGNASPTDFGLSVAASLSGDVTAQMRFQLPSVIPQGTMKLRLLCLANATSGAAKFTVKDGICAPGASPSAVTLTSETQSTITWASGFADKYQEVKVTLTAVPSSNGILVVAITLNTSGYTLAQIMTMLIPTVIWE